ncbi:transcriptional regulator TetR family [Vibrio maritimus]|uniref:Transcriptional regulator TetR family n=2 Tax=Vibrio TaxID=662 RepID=A0A090SVU6_9VIBR|nr:transcriptional regulator TetR family [Vibrio maritimus]
MWKYRFFYANLPEILQRDPKLHEEYIEVQERLQGNLVNILKAFVELDLLTINDKELKSLVTTLHMMAVGWLSYQSAMSPRTKITEEVIQQGMLQMIHVVKPLATDKGKEQLTLLEDGVRMMGSPTS